MPEMDPELGPEPTQIGAMPLISFGETTPLVSTIGEPARPRRPSGGALPPPTATFLPEAVEMSTGKRNKLLIIIGIAVVVIAILVIVLVAR